MSNIITAEDVLNVAKQLNIKVTKQENQMIVDNYVDNLVDPWNVVVEDMLYALRQDRRKVVVTKTITFKTTASLEVVIPSEVGTEEIGDFLLNNGDWWEGEMTEKLAEKDPQHESEFDEVRYDVYETIITHTFGGTL